MAQNFRFKDIDNLVPPGKSQATAVTPELAKFIEDKTEGN